MSHSKDSKTLLTWGQLPSTPQRVLSIFLGVTELVTGRGWIQPQTAQEPTLLARSLEGLVSSRVLIPSLHHPIIRCCWICLLMFSDPCHVTSIPHVMTSNKNHRITSRDSAGQEFQQVDGDGLKAQQGRPEWCGSVTRMLLHS